jgi:phosphonate utilization transcriptional regulator
MTAAPTPIDILRQQSLSGLVREQLLEMIQRGDLTAGSKIVESDLAERLGVSRGPVREALRALEGSGLVWIEKNRGFFVRTVSADEASNIYAVRAALDRLAGETLARRITDAEIATLRRLVERMEKAVAKGDVDTYYPLNLEFHDRLLDFAGNPTLAATSQRLITELYLFRCRSLVQSGSLALSHAEHRRIFDALAARDPQAAASAMWDHVEAARVRMFASLATNQP